MYGPMDLRTPPPGPAATAQRTPHPGRRGPRGRGGQARALRGLVGAAALAALLLSGCGYPPPPSPQGPAAGVQETVPSGADSFDEGSGIPPVTFPDGLKVIDLKVGTGPAVTQNEAVNIQYTGWLSNGTKFDSSRERGQPLCAVLVTSAPNPPAGCTPVIPGWDEGIPGMKVGGRRKLIIPPQLAYGDQGQPPTIPPNATLVFIVEVVSIQPLPGAAASPSP
jgi:hypothetical protein